ncbi:hypothetical protein [Lentzea cavernae]|nr:hypothetical protein [Lentzea cavernae]
MLNALLDAGADIDAVSAPRRQALGALPLTAVARTPGARGSGRPGPHR